MVMSCFTIQSGAACSCLKSHVRHHDVWKATQQVRAAAESGPEGEIGGAPAGFVLDPSSGYYYSAETGMYYDAASGGYFSSSDSKWYSYDPQSNQYVEYCSTSG